MIVECSKLQAKKNITYPTPNTVDDDCFRFPLFKGNPQILTQGLQYVYCALVIWRRAIEVFDLYLEEIIGIVFVDVDWGIVGASYCW